MTLDEIIGLIGLVLAVSGWAAYFQVRGQARAARSKELRETLDELSRLAGEWADRVADTSEWAGSFQQTRAAIRRFMDRLGQYEDRLATLVARLPDSPSYGDLRGKLKTYRRDARGLKEGMIAYLNDDPPPTEEQWKQIRQDDLDVLRGECTELQSLLAALRHEIGTG